MAVGLLDMGKTKGRCKSCLDGKENIEAIDIGKMKELELVHVEVHTM